MIGFTILSIIYASALIYVGASGMSITTKFVTFIVIDFIFAKKVILRRDEYSSYVFFAFSIVLQITYGAFLLLKHSDKNVKIFGIVLLIICLIAIICLIIYLKKTIREDINEKFKSRIILDLRKIDATDDKIAFLQNEIEKLSEGDRDKIEFLESEIKKEKEEEERREEEYKRLSEERIARKKEMEQARSEIIENLENKHFLETDIDNILDKEEGCLLKLYNVIWYEFGNNGELIKPRECESLYITNKRLYARTVREMKTIVYFPQIVNIKRYKEGIEIHKPGPYFFIGIDDEMDIYKTTICIEEAQKYL